MTTMTVTVAGMSCGHCASSVREELAHVSHVQAVDIDLASGTVTIDSDGPVDTSALKNAVEEAGYRLAG